jgi:hypothetical protein
MRFLLDLWFETDNEYYNKELPKLGAFKGKVIDEGREREAWMIEIASIEQLMAIRKKSGHGDILITSFLSVEPFAVIRLNHECE